MAANPMPEPVDTERLRKRALSIRQQLDYSNGAAICPMSRQDCDDILTAAEERDALVADNARLREALALAANRLNRLAVNSIAAGDAHSIEHGEWADDAARAALTGSNADD